MTAEFGYLLRRYREETNIRQKELADAVNVDNSLISYHEKGERNPKPELAVRYLHRLQIPPQYKAEFLLYAQGYSREVVEEVLPEEKRSIPKDVFIAPVPHRPR